MRHCLATPLLICFHSNYTGLKYCDVCTCLESGGLDIRGQVVGDVVELAVYAQEKNPWGYMYSNPHFSLPFVWVQSLKAGTISLWMLFRSSV